MRPVSIPSRIVAVLSMGVVCSLGVSAEGAGPADAAKPAGQSAEAYFFMLATMRKERAKLRSGVCRINGRLTTHYRNEPEADLDGPVTGLIALDEASHRLRYDITRPGWVIDFATLQTLEGGNRATAKHMKGQLTKQFAEDGERSTFWHSDNALCTIGRKGGDDIRLASEYFDPRATNLHTAKTLKDGEAVDAMLDKFRELSEFAETQARDDGLWVIEWKAPSAIMHHKWTMHVNSGQGFTPVLYKFESILKQDAVAGKTWTTEYEFTSNWEQRGDVWLPVAYRFNHQAIGANYTESFDYQMSWESVNQPIDPGLFAYTSFGLPEYVGIADVTTGETRYLREPKLPPAQVRMQRPPVSVRYRPLLSVLVLTALPLGFLFLLLRRRTRAKRTNP